MGEREGKLNWNGLKQGKVFYQLWGASCAFFEQSDTQWKSK